MGLREACLRLNFVIDPFATLPSNIPQANDFRTVEVWGEWDGFTEKSQMSDGSDSFFTIDPDESSGNGDGRVLAYSNLNRSRVA
jgi:hypothetical protein